ncbi:MAG: hypothetical protein ACREF9_18355, partial [Opitutaceae bacterium]
MQPSAAVVEGDDAVGRADPLGPVWAATMRVTRSARIAALTACSVSTSRWLVASSNVRVRKPVGRRRHPPLRHHRKRVRQRRAADVQIPGRGAAVA